MIKIFNKLKKYLKKIKEEAKEHEIYLEEERNHEIILRSEIEEMLFPLEGFEKYKFMREIRMMIIGSDDKVVNQGLFSDTILKMTNPDIFHWFYSMMSQYNLRELHAAVKKLDGTWKKNV